MGTLAVLEGFATALAAPHLTPADCDRLRTTNVRMQEAIDALDVLAFSDHNIAFHQVIYARCPNGHLRRELEAIQERLNTLRSSIFLYIPMRGRVSIDEHEALLALIERGASALEIELAAREHKLHTVAAYEERAALQEDKP